jgi:CBS domain-containing protein
MANSIREIMSLDLFSLRPTDTVEDAIGFFLALGITAAPVLDAGGGLAGMVSLRELLAHRRAATVSEIVHLPAAAISEELRIEDAARMLAERDAHQAVVVDCAGKAVGMVSALDVVRGLVGLPAAGHAVSTHDDRGTTGAESHP